MRKKYQRLTEKVALANHEATRQKRARQRLCAGEIFEEKKLEKKKNNKSKIGRDYGVDSMMRILNPFTDQDVAGIAVDSHTYKYYMMTMFQVPLVHCHIAFVLCFLYFFFSLSSSTAL